MCLSPCVALILWYRAFTTTRPEDVTSTFSMSLLADGRIAVCRGDSNIFVAFGSRKTKDGRDEPEIKTARASVASCASVKEAIYVIAMVSAKTIGRKLFTSPSSAETVDIGLAYPDGICQAWNGIVVSGYREEPRSFFTVEAGSPALVYREDGTNHFLAKWDGRVEVSGPDYDPMGKQICVGVTSNEDLPNGPTSWVEVFGEKGFVKKIPFDRPETIRRARWDNKGGILILASRSLSRLYRLKDGTLTEIGSNLEWQDFVVDTDGRPVGGLRKPYGSSIIKPAVSPDGMIKDSPR